MRSFLILFFIALITFSVSSAHAEIIQNKRATAQAIETYLNGLEMAQSRFIQTTHDGTQLGGTFYLNRPGRLRFEYDDPIEDFVVADGFFIYFYDAELQEQTNAPIGQTLADFILRDDIVLADDILVKDMRRGGGYLQTTLVQAADPEGGTLMLAFKENPLRLAKWRIVDAQGLITEVELTDLKSDVSLSPTLFVFKNPSRTRLYNN